MDGIFVTLFGVGAIVFSTVSFLPQLIKSYKTKQVKDLSYWMLIIYILGNACWLGYGLLTFDPIILITDSIIFVFVITLLAVKIRYNRE